MKKDKKNRGEDRIELNILGFEWAYLTKFLVLIRGALTPPPMMLEPVM